MPSYLSFFEGCSHNREKTFIKAVNSFVGQSYQNKELIIVADGCETTESIYNKRFSTNNQIKLLCIPKQAMFSGAIRQRGIEIATGDLITYLDSDDYYLNTHLSNIAIGLKQQYDWVYFNNYCELKKKDKMIYNAELQEDHIGTSNIAHRKGLEMARWDKDDYSGRKEDWHFIQQLIHEYPKRTKIYGCGYVITHIVYVKNENQNK